jgi:hypothetical protein
LKKDDAGLRLPGMPRPGYESITVDAEHGRRAYSTAKKLGKSQSEFVERCIDAICDMIDCGRENRPVPRIVQEADDLSINTSRQMLINTAVNAPYKSLSEADRAVGDEARSELKARRARAKAARRTARGSADSTG